MLQVAEATRPNGHGRKVVKTASQPLLHHIYRRNMAHPGELPDHQIPFPPGKTISHANLSLILSGDYDVVVLGEGSQAEIILYR